ncbi:MAG: SoxR reducing system RseC family protein [Clostridia bacterium]|nr:SoxR reducing system RseC family protein [Clostridia bacterium]
MATIVYARPEACEKCGGCGAASHQGTICLKADCAEGNWVRIELPKTRFLQAAAMAYVLPLFGLLLGLGAGYWGGGKTDGFTLAGGALGLGLSILLLRFNERRIAGRPEWQPHVLDVYLKKPAPEDIGCGGSYRQY